MKCQPSGLLALVNSGNVWTGPGVQQHVLQCEQPLKANSHTAMCIYYILEKSSRVLKYQAQWFISYSFGR